ncbi:MAG TPA: outer membrane beta-barrel protein [Longimicrobiales bacterium]|nr:outer membrane beta-barrel protein [Longimicrobiales bacterium]
MIRSARIAALAAVLLLAGAARADAQIGIAAGPTVAIGSLGDITDLGYHVQLSAGLSVPLFPIALRIDGAWNQFPETGTDGGLRVLSGSANAVFSIPSVGLTPYVIGGLGAYNSRWAEEDEPGHEHGGEGSTTNLGVNVGVGVRLGLPGLSAFAEARLHNLFNEGDATRFIPISLGLRF